MCCNNNRRGPQGPEGPTGAASFPAVVKTISVAVPVTAMTTINVGTAASSGTLFCWGHLVFSDSALRVCTVTPEIDGTSITAHKSISAVDTSGISIPITFSGAIVGGNQITLDITMSAYTSNAQVVSACLFYSIVE